MEIHEIQESIEALRAAVETHVLKYVQDHYPDGVTTVYAPSETQIVVAIVDNKYNPSNYW